MFPVMALRSRGQKIWDRNPQRLAEYFEGAERDVSLCTLNCTNIGPVEAAPVGKLFLGDTQLRPKESYVRRQSLAKLNTGLSKCSFVLHSTDGAEGSAPRMISMMPMCLQNTSSILKVYFLKESGQEFFQRLPPETRRRVSAHSFVKVNTDHIG